MLYLYAALLEEGQEQLCFDRIFHDYRKQMLLVALRILEDPHDAEDAVQNAFLGIARNLGKLRAGTEPAALRAYVLTAAKNAALSLLAQRQRRAVPTDPAELPRCPAPDPYARTAAALDCRRLVELIAAMPQPYREVLQLVYVHGNTPTEAARILFRTPDVLRTQLRRGKKLLRKLCEQEELYYGTE